jgi:X-X-X-Leu-X-X-Gly heptad repeat protein
MTNPEVEKAFIHLMIDINTLLMLISEVKHEEIVDGLSELQDKAAELQDKAVELLEKYQETKNA